MHINEEDTVIDDIVRQKIGLHNIKFPAREAVEVRRQAVQRLTNARLDGLGAYSIDAEAVSRRNIENMIGAVQVPVGVAGPLRVNGQFARGQFYVPLATTEGALVASVNRGCKAITAAGGAIVRIISDEMTRAPVFKVRDVTEALRLVEWVLKPSNVDKLRQAVKQTTRHGELLRVDPYVVDDNVFLRCAFDTKDALGMNMVTIATDKLADVIASELDVQLAALSGNMCIDKKPAAMNLIAGRGKNVIAEVNLPRDVAKSELKTNPEDIAEVHYRKNVIGSIKAGSLGFNAHAANVVAATFIATGQDVAHVVEGSTTITSILAKEGQLHASVTMSSLPVGTVGGGTGILTQQECLSMLGVAGGGDPPGTHAKKLAEIICAAVLAGELSLVAALATRDLAKAHKTLGR